MFLLPHVQSLRTRPPRSADGNPKPRVTWSKISGVGQVNMNGHDNTLQIKNVAYNDSGSYVCMATSILGKAQKTVKLTVEGDADNGNT